MAKLIRKFELPNNFTCNIGNSTVISVYDDKITFGNDKFLFKYVVAVRPSKERDGFIMELEDGIYNPIITEKIVTMHISGHGLFAKGKAKKFGMEIYTILYSAITNQQ